jgi:hypothetical protein
VEPKKTDKSSSGERFVVDDENSNQEVAASPELKGI